MVKVAQSYWRRKVSNVPIWKQQNDDDKIGKKFKVIRTTPSGIRDEWQHLDKETARKIHTMAIERSEDWPGHRDVWTEEEDD